MIKKGTLFSGIIGGLCLGMAVASASLLPVHAAEEEDHTAGVSMGKEADEEISTYARARVEAGWKLDAKGWWYQDEDGGWAQRAWRQIDGKWY